MNSQQMENSGSTQKLSHLPLFRFTSTVIVLIALDSLICISLWIAGGDSLYMEESVKEFSFTHSTFDLACISSVRCVILIGCFYYLEHYSLLKVSVGEHDKQRISSRVAIFCQLVIYIVSGVSLLYSVVKGSLILRSMVQGTWNDIDKNLSMHITYKVLCVVSIAFPAIEIIFCILSSCCLRRMIRRNKLRLLVNLDEIDNEKPIKKKADIKRIVLLAKPEYPLLLFGIIWLSVSSGCFSYTPFLFGKVINFAIPGQTNCSEKYGKNIPPGSICVSSSMARMNREVLILVAVFVVGSIGVTFRAIVFNLAGERFIARLRKQLFTAIINQEMGFFDKSRVGELTNRLSADTQVIQSAVTENLSVFFRFSMQMLISIGMMFYVSAKLTAVLLSVIPVIAISAVQYGRFLKRLRKEFQDELAFASSTAEESFGNIMTVRAFSNEGKMTKFYSKNIDKSYTLGRKLAFLIGTFMGAVTFFMYGAAALVLWYGGYLVFHEKLQAGTLISLMLYTLTLTMCFAFLSNVYGELMQAVGASIRIFELLDRDSEVSDGSQVLEALKGEILFDRVCFSYPSRPEEQVLQSVSFEVLPGQVVALVGQSGGGKSTVVKLIEHFYELSSGRILLSGYNIRQLDPVWFRKHIGLVSQEPVLFATSIADNISYGRDDATQSEVEEAAKQANAHNFIMSFEQGYDTMVGERGIRLSGGQKQRVAIARALLLNPDILLLDEATSALDAESEHLVQEAIDRAMEKRTVLVIAHRLSTVKNASQVIVLDQGKVVEQGTHNQLLETGGVYKQLVIRQLTHHDKDL